MFRKVHVPLLGLVENMAYYCCPNCGHQDNIFGSGGVAAAAEDLGVPLLGQVSQICYVIVFAMLCYVSDTMRQPMVSVRGSTRCPTVPDVCMHC